jgi:hypothetical protein
MSAVYVGTMRGRRRRRRERESVESSERVVSYKVVCDHNNLTRPCNVPRSPQRSDIPLARTAIHNVPYHIHLDSVSLVSLEYRIPQVFSSYSKYNSAGTHKHEFSSEPQSLNSGSLRLYNIFPEKVIHTGVK